MAIDFPRSVTVYGTGLMGSSFALALKQQNPSIKVYGVDRTEVLNRAQQLGIVETSPPAQSDLVVLATPVGDILRLLEDLKPIPEIILDLGSTKVEICAKAERLRLPFVGGHPMTGSERSGPEAASADLFHDTRFFLCSISTTPAGAVAKVETIVRAIGAIPHVIDPAEHDKLVAQLSHLPQIISTLLADHTAQNNALAGPGLRSLTRLAASPFHVWRDILTTSGSLPQELQSFIERLRSILDALESKNLKEIESAFERANRSASGGSRE